MPHRFVRAFAAGLALGIPLSLGAATFTVINTNDSGAGSLRQAIVDANARIGSDWIAFAIPGSAPFTIAPYSALPQITDPVVLDGATQPGFEGRPVVQLSGALAGARANGLLVLAPNCRISGLCVVSFALDGIQLQGGGGCVIQGNYLGVNASGQTAKGNGLGGLTISDASANWIGGTNAAARNIISGNAYSGVFVMGFTSTDNRILGNYIGLNAAGSAPVPNLQGGISVIDSYNNWIGGRGPGEGNVVSGNTQNGLAMWGAATGNVIQGNYFGLDCTGTNALPNSQSGVYLLAVKNNRVGGTEPGAGNVISGNLECGVLVSDKNATNNLILGNRIGTDPAGVLPLGNALQGISLSDSRFNIVGGPAPGAGNLIAANREAGVYIAGTNAWSNIVSGNYIGTVLSGLRALSNSFAGVAISGAGRNVVGGTAPGAGNLISGNGQHGVYITGAVAVSNVIQGNYIGSDLAGTGFVPNGLAGVSITGAARNVIGGAELNAGNLISGNTGWGVRLGAGADATRIQGNRVGCDRDGLTALPNVSGGVYLFGAASNLIGGTTPGAGNQISGNAFNGIRIVGPGADGNVIQGNLIGLQRDGSSPLGNENHNVECVTAANTLIGGVQPGAANRIAFSRLTGFDGVRIREDCLGTLVRGNAIFSDADMGIDLGATGVGQGIMTAVPPVLASISGRYKVTLAGTLSSRPSRAYTLDFYCSAAADPSGSGEGEKWLGSALLSTDAGGQASFSVVFTNAFAATNSISATATDSLDGTSEFSVALLNPTPASPDSDGDGIPDDFETAFGLNPASKADGALDSDGDGLTNSQDYRAGTSPRDPASALRIVRFENNRSDARLFLSAGDSGPCVVEYSSSVTGPWTLLQTVAGGSRLPLPIVDKAAMAAGRRFYRVRAL